MEEQITIITGGHEPTRRNRRGRWIEVICAVESPEVRKHLLRQVTYKLNRKA